MDYNWKILSPRLDPLVYMDMDSIKHRFIFQKLERGITTWKGLGAYTDENTEVLYMVVSKYEVGRLKHIIRKYDPKAFIVVNEGVNVDGHFLKKL